MGFEAFTKHFSVMTEGYMLEEFLHSKDTFTQANTWFFFLFLTNHESMFLRPIDCVLPMLGRVILTDCSDVADFGSGEILVGHEVLCLCQYLPDGMVWGPVFKRPEAYFAVEIVYICMVNLRRERYFWPFIPIILRKFNRHIKCAALIRRPHRTLYWNCPLSQLTLVHLYSWDFVVL